MVSGLLSSIQSLSTKLLDAIRGTTSTLHQQRDPSSPVTNQNKSVREDLQKLSWMLMRIQAVQQDAEEREIHDRSVQLWLEELRGVGYQAEDVLDEFYYEVLRSIVASGDAAIEAYHRDGGTKRKFAEMHASSSLPSYSYTIAKVSIPDGMAEKIKGITERFEEISNARRDLHLREEDGTRLVKGRHIRPPTSSHVDERVIFGREEEKENIISLLNPNIGPDFMVLPIVGMGGFGKTTLAQLVYHDSRIHGLFNKRCWISVSEDFDLVRLTKGIIESVSNTPCEFSELNILQDVLKEKIRGLGLFLVLDDVWNEKRNMWEFFRVGFLGAKFVRILTTTRNTSVAKIMQTTSPFKLSSLPEENCWSLFKHFAFGNRETSENANLYKIGCGIVKKCKGSPLAIKVLGGILRYEMVEEKWREILGSDISQLDETEEIMPALRLSYEKLPLHLKPCFLYLSMFPKDTLFEKDMVVRLWMAQGYINDNTRKWKTLEEIGSEYFDELLGRSLVNHHGSEYFGEFQGISLVNYGPSTKYFLHDLIHDLARSISQEAYQPVLENDQHFNGPCKVYHLYITKQKFLGSLLATNNYWSVRTFVKEYPREQNLDFAIFSEIACSRALHLGYSMLPNTLGTLKHLRYLSIGNSHMETLPETLCLLYNLQTLDLNSAFLQELPENIKNLINLRYFQLSSNKIQQLPESIFLLCNLHALSLRNCRKLKELPRGIEQLTRLHILDLPESHTNMPSGIGKLPTLKQLSGHFSVTDPGMIGGLGVLKDLNKLSGLLCISGLRNIIDAKYSRNANLASKPNLHNLILNFQDYCSMLIGFRDKELHLHLTDHSSNNAKSENDEKIHDVVLQNLQPHGNLTELSILNYEGRVFPSWLLNPLLPNLKSLTLKFCTEPIFLPPFGQLPYLRFLKISGNTEVRNVGDELNTYSLLAEYGSSKQPKELGYPSLEVLSVSNMLNLVEWQAHDGDFPSLKQLTIENCPKLWKIAIIPQKVGGVSFKNCPKLKFLTCPSVIKNMKIHECGFREIKLQSVSEYLKILNCKELISINWMDGGINSVKEVSFEYCPKLELVTIPARTKKLIIKECGFREIIFKSVSEYLAISNCKVLISINWMDGGRNSVREVSFKYCPKLELVTIPAKTKKLIIKECGFREIIFQSVREYLTVSNCKDLISINWIGVGLNHVRKVRFEYCPKLELVTVPAGTEKLIIKECGFHEIIFQSVDYLTVSNCKDLISINWMKGGINSVREVSFEYCPKLELVTIPVRTKKLIIKECGFHEIIFQSVSEYLAVSNCKDLFSINWMDGGINSVREVSFEYCPKLELVTIPAGNKKLIINECGFREIIFQSVSEYLAVSNCKDLISITWIVGGINSVHWRDQDSSSHPLVKFVDCPQLKVLEVPKEVEVLKIKSCSTHEIVFSSKSKVRSVDIYGCPELFSVHWMDGDVPFLKDLFFKGCRALRSISVVPNKIRRLGITECGLHEIQFPTQCKIASVHISCCPELISLQFLQGDLPLLEKLAIKSCPQFHEVLTIPYQLKELKIVDCCFHEIHILPQSKLQRLIISECANLTAIKGLQVQFPTGDVSHPMMEMVQVRNCPRMDFGTQGNSYLYQRVQSSNLE